MEKKSNYEFTPDFIDSLEQNEVFVFGSNLNGVHSGGASLKAFRDFGAEWGQAEGPQGQSYAIPTDIRGEAVGNISDFLKRHIDMFIDYARAHQEKTFLVTKVGCGTAGFYEDFMAPFFRDALELKNVRLPKEFVEILTEEDNDGKQKIYNLIILDESGSMETIEQEAISGLNETFQTIRYAQKEHQEQKHFISFVTFNSAQIRKVFDRIPVDANSELKWTDYNPGECTPLFDAMGISLNELKRRVKEKDVVLVTIITDGYENASRQYRGSDIKKMVSELKEKGWVFAYIGTNQDVDAVADQLGVRSRMSYEYSDTGTRQMFAEEDRHRRSFYDRLSRFGRSIVEDDLDYFSLEEDSKK